ncbi:MAG: RNA 2',3'-cyclic phosphodiesterase [Elusimicrobia bacterium]|nr:RNA 2',3'-cyclic phosphodiesterase [Elusimicrobiota bacterium]
MRLFIAVPISSNVREAADRAIAKLRATGADFKWVDPGALHMTLCFLGDMPESSRPGIERAMTAAAAGAGPFEIEFDRLGFFGSADHPRVLWLGVGSGARQLKSLEAAISRRLVEERLEFKREERDYEPHLTLGRMRSAKNLERLRGDIKAFAIVPTLRSQVDRVVLYESQLSPQGPAYAALTEFPLGAMR